jgi:hypothetical protein
MAEAKRVSSVFKMRLHTIQHVEDCKKIQTALLSVGLEASLYEAQELWKAACVPVTVPWISLDDEAVLLVTGPVMKADYESLNGYILRVVGGLVQALPAE